MVRNDKYVVTFWNKLGIEVLQNIMKISSRPREIMADDWRWYWQTELNHNTRDPDLRRAMHILHTAMQHNSVVLKTIFPLPPSANICSYCGHLSHLWIPANNCESLAHHLQHFRLSKHIIMTVCHPQILETSLFKVDFMFVWQLSFTDKQQLINETSSSHL